MRKSDLILIAAALGVLYVSGNAAATYFGSLSISQLKELAQAAGFGVDSSIAAAVAMAESSGDPKAVGDIDIPAAGSESYGLWQINSYYHPEFGPDFTTLFNPQTNALAAFSVYSKAGSSFSPWTTFKTGAYLAYLPAAQAA